ncbi:MAG: hypothetical protein GYB35_14485 [Algicola sp.]|nr:hypothetical protein [Algicola sp.]
MNVTLKNNRKLLKNGKRKPFTKMNGGSGKIQTYKPYSLPKLQPHILRRIRRKVKKENRKLFIKKLLIAIVVLMLLLLWLTQL